MSRTYTDTPEPRYVEKAEYAVNSGDLPTPTIEDVNKVVAVNEEGKYELAEVSSSDIPEPTVSDVGKVLGVDDEGKYTLTEGGSDIPEPTTADEGKVLLVDDAGEYALGEPPSGLPDATGSVGGMLMTKPDGTYYLSGHVKHSTIKTVIPDSFYQDGTAIILSANMAIVDTAEYRNEVASSGSAALILLSGAGLRMNFNSGGAKSKIYLGNFNKNKTTSGDTDYIVIGGGSNNTHRADIVKIGGIDSQGNSTNCIGYIALGSTSPGGDAVAANDNNSEAVLVGGPYRFGYKTTGLYLKNIATLNANGLTVNGKTITLAQLESIISPPTTQGTYSLQCSVDSEGAATYSWV